MRDLIIKWYSSEFDTYKKESLDTLKHNKPELLNQYEEDKDTIATLVRSVQYWHGTGRFQYARLGKSKYEGASKHETTDVLKNIIAYRGLTPQYDPWFEKYVKTPHSLSLANQWFYGKMYAQYHQDENTELLYEIVPTSFWFNLWFKIQLTERYGKIIPAFLIVYLFSNVLRNQAKKWLSTFRSDTDKRWPFWKILTARSDIVGNYPILFAIKSEVKTISIMKLARFFETRTSELVPFDKMSFVAVPLSNIEETQKCLSEHNVSTPLIPLEYIELHMLGYSLKEIVYQRSF